MPSQPSHRIHLNLGEAHDGLLVRCQRSLHALLNELFSHVRELFHRNCVCGVRRCRQRLRLVACRGRIVVCVLVVHALEEVLKDKAYTVAGDEGRIIG